MMSGVWDGNFYVDEAIRHPIKSNILDKRITLIGAGVGIRQEDPASSKPYSSQSIRLLDWCGIAYNSYNNSQWNNNKNGNGFWNILGQQCLQLMLDNYQDYRPSKIYICNHISFYIMRAIALKGVSTNLSTEELKELEKLEKLSKDMKPVTHKTYKNQNGIYKAKQEIGKKTREKLKIPIGQEDESKILEGKLYDVRHLVFL